MDNNGYFNNVTGKYNLILRKINLCEKLGALNKKKYIFPVEFWEFY